MQPINVEPNNMSYFHFTIKQVYTINVVSQKWPSIMPVNLFIQNVKQIGASMMNVPSIYVDVVECGQELINVNPEEAPCMEEQIYNTYTLADKYGNQYKCFYVRVNPEYNNRHSH